MINQQKFAPIGLVIGCVVFGLGSVIVAHLPIGSYAIAFWRLAVATVIFALLTRFFAQKIPPIAAIKKYALLAGVLLAADLALWHESIHAVGPGISTLLNSLQIFWLTAISVIFFQEKLNILQIISLVLAIAGVALIASPEFGHNGNALWGFVSGTLSGLMLSLSMVCVQKVHKIARTPIFPLMFYISLGGMMALILPSIWLDSHQFFPQTWAHIGWILVYGAVMQCFAWGMIAYAIPLLPITLAGLLLLTEPVAALLIDFVFLDKEINAVQWTGAALTLVAIYLGSAKKA